MRALKPVLSVQIKSTYAVTTQAHEGIETMITNAKDAATAVTTQAHEGIETVLHYWYLGQKQVTTQAHEGIETRIMARTLITARSNNSSP